MVIRVTCSNCSFVFYSGEKLVSVEDVIKKYGNRCPKCLRELIPGLSKISIKLHQRAKE